MADRAFRYGDGVFATLRLRGGLLLDASAHVERLARSASVIGLALPEAIRSTDSIVRVLGRLGAGPDTDGVVRIQLSAGPGGRGYGRLPTDDPLRGAWELVELLPPPADRRLTLTVLDDGALPAPALPAVKSCSALAHVLCARQAERLGFVEAVRVSGGAILEAAAANVFWASGTTLFTAADSLPLYPGVTRSVVLRVAPEAGWTVRQGGFPASAISGADAVFLTNATRGMEPVVVLEDGELGWPEALQQLQSKVERAREEAACRLTGGAAASVRGPGG